MTGIVYSALFGSYEELIEQPVARDSSTRFVCFTDNPDLRSNTWELQLCEPRFAWDPTRSAREIKILGHPEVNAYATSLWIDNRVRLTADPDELIPTLLGDADIALPLHSFRASVREEFSAVLDHGFDRSERVREQLHYLEGFTPQVLDQLSFNLVMELSDLRLNPIHIDNFQSPFHEWVSVPKDSSILMDRGFEYPLTRDLRDRWARSYLYRKGLRAKKRVVQAMSNRSA